MVQGRLHLLQIYPCYHGGRRRKLFIHKICIDDDNWIQGDEAIVVASDYFQYSFPCTYSRVNEGILQHIPGMINEDQNTRLQSMPTMDELKQVIFSTNPNSAPVLDGFGGMFYQSC